LIIGFWRDPDRIFARRKMPTAQLFSFIATKRKSNKSHAQFRKIDPRRGGFFRKKRIRRKSGQRIRLKNENFFSDDYEIRAGQMPQF
jgi:hypothetical protein